MPSTSKKQARFMAMCAHSPSGAKKECPPMRVAKEFNLADKGTGILKKKHDVLKSGYHKLKG